MKIVFSKNKIKLDDLINLLLFLNDSYIPQLDKQVNIYEYAKKLYKNAKFIFVKDKNKYIGLLAYYLSSDEVFITSIGIHKHYHGKQIGNKLFNNFLSNIKKNNIKKIRLHVNTNNTKAQKFYLKKGFIFEKIDEETILAIKKINYEKQ